MKEKVREKRREEKREDKKREKARQEKRQDEEEREYERKKKETRSKRRDDFFLEENVSRPSNPPDELAPHVSKKNPFRTNYSSIFSAKVQNLAVFSFIYMIRIRFFGPGELIQNGFSGAR